MSTSSFDHWGRFICTPRPEAIPVVNLLTLWSARPTHAVRALCLSSASQVGAHHRDGWCCRPLSLTYPFSGSVAMYIHDPITLCVPLSVFEMFLCRFHSWFRSDLFFLPGCVDWYALAIMRRKCGRFGTGRNGPAERSDVERRRIAEQ